MKKHSLLQWARLEEDGHLSLSNLAVFVGLVVMLVHGADMATSTAFLVAMLNYGHRRIERNKVKALDDSAEARLAAAESKVDALARTLVVSPEDFKGLANEVGSLKLQLGLKRIAP